MVRVWEAGVGQHPVDRALTILAAARPEASREELTAHSVGQRDAQLLSVRQRTFGSRMVGVALCPDCGESLEFALEAENIRVSQDEVSTDGTYAIATEDYELRFRLPNSLDLAAVARSETLGEGRALLVERCVLECRRNGVDVEVAALPETVVSALSKAFDERDPQADVQLDLACPACGRSWQMPFDILAYLWAEICAQAQRLLHEVHTLARTYGWREADILSMSAIRRQFYLDAAG